MAIHQNLKALSEEVIDEYLAVARHCIADRKPDGGIYGYSAVLLLFCVVDALSNHLGCPEHSFAVLNDPSFGLELSSAQLKNLKDWYRHLLAHVGMIAPGTMLTPETDGDAFEFSPTGQPTTIRVLPFYRIVEKAWKAFDRTRLRPEAHLKPKHIPVVPADVMASTAMSFTASGAPIPPTKKK
jgi:hypothetical protein